MMIAKNQGGLQINTSYGVLMFVFGALMIMDVLTGGIVRQYYSLRTIEYGMISFFAIATFGEIVKEYDSGGRLLRSRSFHGL